MGCTDYTRTSVGCRGIGVERMPKTIGEKLVGYGIPAASGAVRYGIPLAGLTAAGSALADLTGGLYEAASNTPILPEEENSNTLMIRIVMDEK